MQARHNNTPQRHRLRSWAGIAVTAAGAFVALVGPAGAQCVGDACVPNPLGFSYVGTITDPLNRPVVDAAVRDDKGRTALTDADGNYRLDQSDWNPATRMNPTGTELRASKLGLKVETARALASAAGQDARYDFRLRYAVQLAIAPQLDVEPGSTIHATITGYPPQPETVCVPVRLGGDPPVTQGNAVLQATDTDGKTTWTFDVHVPDDAQRGHWYRIDVQFNDCATGINLAADGDLPATNQEFRIAD